MSYDETRKYIHDLANNFSILDASISRALTLMGRNYPEAADELARLKKADEYIKKSIFTLKSFREHIHSEIQKDGEVTPPDTHT
ncbi:MAG TPA: hypothetical protein VNJ08_04530 [Bacteriovoracaceae bacterium]|nr:hypothetical protein [Bacteriovoracaceae bacterium]